MSTQTNEALSTISPTLTRSTYPQNARSEAMPSQTNEALSTTHTTPNSNPQSNEVTMSPVIPFTQPVAANTRANDEAFIEQAKAIPADEIVPCRADVYDAVRNVVTGVQNVMKPATIARIKALSETNFEAILTLPDIGQAVLRASEAIPPAPKGSDVPALVQRGLAVRKVLRDQIQLLVSLGELNSSVLEATKLGRGPQELSKHLRMEAETIARCAAKESLAVKQALLDEAQALGEALWEAGDKASDESKAATAREEAIALRDRLWTLFSRQYFELRRAARYLFNDKADAIVPPMKAGKKGPRKAKVAKANDQGNEGKVSGTATEQPVYE